MKEITITKYKCEICEGVFDTKKEAQKCEDKPVTQDKGVKIGDFVKILNGDGALKNGKVLSINILDKDWGHYARTRYHHTVNLCVEVIGGFGVRVLTFDDYEVIKNENI